MVSHLMKFDSLTGLFYLFQSFFLKNVLFAFMDFILNHNFAYFNF